MNPVEVSELQTVLAASPAVNFAHSPRTLVRILTDPVEADFHPGDLIFGNRLSLVQRLNTLSGDSLTHGGVIADIEGAIRVIEFGARGCFSRSIDEFTSAYRFVAHGRLDISPVCRRAIADEARRLLSSKELRYSWLTVGMIGILSLARRTSPAAMERLVIQISTLVATRVLRHLGHDKVTCSGFVARCVDAACDSCQPELEWPARPRTAPWRGCVTATDAVAGTANSWATKNHKLASKMSTPSDLWVSFRYVFRAVVRRDGNTLLFDLSNGLNSRPRCQAVTHLQLEGGEQGMNPNPIK
jgi:hypothetical protein